MAVSAIEIIIIAIFILYYFFPPIFLPMRFVLGLHTKEPTPLLPVYYQQLIGNAIRQILSEAEKEWFFFQQEKEYAGKIHLKDFTLFTFSNLSPSPQIRKEGVILKPGNARLTACFHLPESATSFIHDLLINKEIETRCKRHNLIFSIRQIKKTSFLPVLSATTNERSIQHLLLHPLSPLVVIPEKGKKYTQSLPPDHPSFIYHLLNNWKEKYRIAYPKECTDEVFNQVEIKYLPEIRPYQSRKIVFITETTKEIAINGYERFGLYVSAPGKVLELAGNAGLGLYNNIGMGCMETKPLPGRKRRR